MKKNFLFLSIMLGMAVLFGCEETPQDNDPTFEGLPTSEPQASTELPEGPTAVDTVDEECFTNQDYYLDKLYNPLLSAICSDCHSGQGSAKDTSFVLLPPEAPEANKRNFERFSDLARLDYDGAPLMVEKPLGRANHGGGPVLREDDPRVVNLISMIERRLDRMTPILRA